MTSFACVALLLLASVAAVHQQRVAGAVCPDPANPCPGFRPHDLSFVLPTDSVARAEDRSASFYAVMLQTGKKCSIGEPTRAAAQRLFPTRKVFSNRFECDDDVENNVQYAGADGRFAFLAVYAGATQAEGKAALASIVAGGRFKGANLRQLRAVRVRP